MALSPADYAAYSRATGTPYPEDPEERAQIAPDVLEFRRNQLRAPQEESNLLGILGAAALGLGALRGGVGIARALTGERAQVPPSSRPPVTPQGEQAVRTASAEGRRRAAEEVTRQARTERPVGVVQTDLSQKNLEDFIRSSPAFGRIPTKQPKESATPGIVRSLPAAAERPDLLAGLTAAPGYAQEFVGNRVAEQMASDLIDEVNAFNNPAARSELARQQASVQGQKRKDLWDLVGQIRNESLVTTQESIRPVVSNQALGALESGEDQMTGRMKAQLSRNEDLDMSQVEMLENIAQENMSLMRAQAEPSQMVGYVPDEPINQAASQLPDGLPVDQAEGFRAFSQRATQRKNLLDVQDQMWAFEEELETQGQKAQAWLNKQLEIQKRREPVLSVESKMYDLVGSAAEQGVALEPSRALALLTNPTIELTGEEQRLFGVNPLIGKFALKGQTFEPGQQQTGAMLGLKGEMLRSVSNVGEDPTSFLTQAASGTSIRGRSRIPNVPDESRQRLSSTGRAVTADDVFIDDGGTVTVSPGEELTEMVFESKEPTYTRFVRDPQAPQQRPKFFGPGLASAEELKEGLKQEYAPKGMRAIQTREGSTYFVPVGDPGGIGIYGEERRFASGPIVKFDDPEQERVAGAYTKTAMRAPTEMPFKEKQRGGAAFSDLSSQQLQSFIQNAPEGSMRLAGQKELARRETTKQSLLASELSRRATIEGRDPQIILRQRGFNV
jgi:hypothetical protein